MLKTFNGHHRHPRLRAGAPLTVENAAYQWYEPRRNHHRSSSDRL